MTDPLAAARSVPQVPVTGEQSPDAAQQTNLLAGPSTAIAPLDEQGKEALKTALAPITRDVQVSRAEIEQLIGQQVHVKADEVGQEQVVAWVREGEQKLEQRRRDAEIVTLFGKTMQPHLEAMIAARKFQDPHERGRVLSILNPEDRPDLQELRQGYTLMDTVRSAVLQHADSRDTPDSLEELLATRAVGPGSALSCPGVADFVNGKDNRQLLRAMLMSTHRQRDGEEQSDFDGTLAVFTAGMVAHLKNFFAKADSKTQKSIADAIGYPNSIESFRSFFESEEKCQALAEYITLGYAKFLEGCKNGRVSFPVDALHGFFGRTLNDEEVASLAESPEATARGWATEKGDDEVLSVHVIAGKDLQGDSFNPWKFFQRDTGTAAPLPAYAERWQRIKGMLTDSMKPRVTVRTREDVLTLLRCLPPGVCLKWKSVRLDGLLEGFTGKNDLRVYGEAGDTVTVKWGSKELQLSALERGPHQKGNNAGVTTLRTIMRQTPPEFDITLDETRQAPPAPQSPHIAENPDA